MNMPVALASRLAVVGFLGMVCSNVALAQQLAAFIIQPPLATSSASVVYQDRYINGGLLPPDLSADSMESTDRAGLARSLQVDGVFSVLSSNEPGARRTLIEDGVVVRSQWDTTAWGAWSLDAAGRTGGSGLSATAQGQGGVIALRQRGMPFDGGWLADNALGDINSPQINLARAQSRFYLPTTPLQGLSSEWRGPSGVQIVAGGGQPGVYDGIEVPDFRALGGFTDTAGLEWSPGERWLLGTQLVNAQGVGLYGVSDLSTTAMASSTTGLLSAAWQGTRASTQLNLLDGDVSGHHNALGVWFDASWTTNRTLQTAGVFRIDPNLTWGNQLIADDVQGGYYRIGYQSRQWLCDAGIDEVRSVSGLGGNTTFLTADTRYQLLRDWGVGAVANTVRNPAGNSWSLENYVDYLDGWGTSRAQFDLARNPEGQDATVTLQQAWSTHTGLHLSTSVAADRIVQSPLAGEAQDSTALRLALYGGGQITTRVGVEANLQWAAVLAGHVAPGISMNASLSWQLRPAWSVLLSYYDSRVGSWTPLIVQSPLTPPVATLVPSIEERGVFLTLRYQRSSGSHFAPLGGGPGAGSGEITGVVYLDANANRRMDADEVGVSNLLVILDGRFSVQTDDAGRFDFPVVAAGHHVITVSSDNLPLPWTLADGGRAEVQVNTRSRSEVDLAASRLR